MPSALGLLEAQGRLLEAKGRLLAPGYGASFLVLWAKAAADQEGSCLQTASPPADTDWHLTMPSAPLLCTRPPTPPHPPQALWHPTEEEMRLREVARHGWVLVPILPLPLPGPIFPA